MHIQTKKLIQVFGFLLVLFATSQLRAEQFQIDPVHSDVTFKVKHMVVSKVIGRFDAFSGTFFYDEKNVKLWKASATIEAASINTANKDRDNHLRTKDFFEVEKYPAISFLSTKATGLTRDKAKLEGLLTLHGVQKPVVLDLEIGGKIKGMRGEMRAGFEAATKISRKDFGIVWNKVLESGGLVVGDEVEITIHVEGIAQ